VYELALGQPLPSRGPQWEKIRRGEISLPPDFSEEFKKLIQVDSAVLFWFLPHVCSDVCSLHSHIKSMLEADANKRPSAEELLAMPELASTETRLEIERKRRRELEEEVHNLEIERKRRRELEEEVHNLEAELEWRRRVMDSTGWRAWEGLTQVTSRLEECIRCFFPPSPFPSLSPQVVSCQDKSSLEEK